MKFPIKRVYVKLTVQEADDPEGKWVTIRGTHVLIRDGETASQAFKRTTGKDLSEPERGIYDKPDSDNAKNLNTGNDKGSGAGDKTNMQTEPTSIRTRDSDEQPYGTPKNPTNFGDARVAYAEDPASLSHLTQPAKQVTLPVRQHGWDKPWHFSPINDNGEWVNYKISDNNNYLPSRNDLDVIAKKLRTDGYVVSVKDYNRSISVRGRLK